MAHKALPLAYLPDTPIWQEDLDRWTAGDVLRLVAFTVLVVVVGVLMYAIAFLAAML